VENVNNVATRTRFISGYSTSMSGTLPGAAKTFVAARRAPLYIINNVAFLVGVRWLVRVYAHLGQVCHRSEVVEYQLEHHREALGERLTALETLTT